MRLKNIQVFVYIGIIASGCGPGVVQPERETADRVLLNGFVYTVDAARSVAEAVALDLDIPMIGERGQARFN